MTITETISQLDGLREKVKENNHIEDWDTDETFGGDAVIVKRHEFETGMKGTEVLFEGDWGETEDAEYIVALHNAYPALRRSAIAGEVLAKAVEEYVISHTADHYCAYAGDIDHFIAEQVHAYRSAIEEKNV